MIQDNQMKASIYYIKKSAYYFFFLFLNQSIFIGSTKDPSQRNSSFEHKITYITTDG